jgi:hypothetical protein
MTIDLKDFYLFSDLPEYEYVRILIITLIPPQIIALIPPQIIELYKLQNKIYDGHVYAEVRKVMYGLPQAGKLANDRLHKFLEPHGYIPCDVTPGLWKRNKSDLMFLLVVDNFGVRYTNPQEVDRLIAVLKKENKCTIDWEGERYVELTIKWNYEKGYVDTSPCLDTSPVRSNDLCTPHPTTTPTFPT